MTTSKYGSLWTRGELVLALYLYCQIPFAKTKAKNPEVVRAAKVLGRTPASVARKLGNFGAFDPLLAAEGITGLAHGGKLDREIWDEFYQRWDELVLEANRLLATSNAEVKPIEPDSESRVDSPIIAKPEGPTERKAQATVRLCQAFFRRAILSSYRSSCCVCGLEIPALLVASHIRPWAENLELRADPENGLCLCALHDRAFDRGLLAVHPSLEIVVSESVLRSPQAFTRSAVAAFHGNRIRLPQRFAPRSDCLEWHRKNVFIG